MLKLFGSAGSRSTRAAWALEEAGAEYDYVKIDLMRGEGRKPEYLKVNPSGKVPVLIDGDLLISESAAIITYIGGKFPQSGLVPPVATANHALYLQWCFFCIGEFEQPLWTMAKHRFALPAEWRVPAIMDTAKKEFEVALKLLEQGLADKPYILGDQFSGADILLGHTLNWAKRAEVLQASAAIAAYMERTLERPALANARARESA